MMNKFYLVLLLTAFAVPSVFGQLQFGIKGGIVSASSTLDKKLTQEQLAGAGVDYDELKMKAQDAKVGFQAGLFGRLSLAALYVQPELMFTSTSSKIQVKELTEGEDPVSQVKNQEFKRLDIPIMVGWKFGPAQIGR